MIIILLITIMWIIYALLEGQIEAWYYHCKSYLNIKQIENIPNEHQCFEYQRLIVLLLCTILSFLTEIHKIDIFLLPLSLMCIFPFFHDGIYYSIRNDLNDKIYPLRWWDNSNQSTAIFNLNKNWRIGLFILGVGLLTYLNIRINEWF